MKNLTFGDYFVESEIKDARADLANYLCNSQINLADLNKGLQIIEEWSFNPFKTFAQSGSAGAGAVLGSALGPAGTVLGGMAGNAVGKAGNYLAGKAMSGARVQSIQPVYQQAVQAVDSLSKMLSAPDLQGIADAKSMAQGIKGFQNGLQQFANIIPNIDQQRNVALDQKLQAGGGIGQQLRNTQVMGQSLKG